MKDTSAARKVAAAKEAEVREEVAVKEARKAVATKEAAAQEVATTA